MIYPIYIPSKNRPDAKFLELIKDLDADKYLILEPQNLPTLAEKIKENIQYKKSNITTNNYDDDDLFGF